MGEVFPISSRAELLEALQETLQSAVDAGVPGFSAAISTTSGIIWKSTAGYADVVSKLPINHASIFGIGSITKVFTAVVIFQLIDEKLLKLSDMVTDHLPEEIFHDIGNAKDATIETLLSHRSGIESWEDDPKCVVESRGQDCDPDRIWGKLDTLDYIRRPSPLSPGEFSYSNCNYTLLGLIIENITSRTAESEVRRRIIQHLDLEGTYLEGFEEAGHERIKRVPHRYHWATKEFRETAGICPRFSELEWKGQSLIDATGSNLSVEWLEGGMVSTTSDLLKFAISLRDGELISQKSLDIMQSWQPTKSRAGDVGHGLFRFPTPKGHGNWVGHGGNALGFSGALFWLECADCVVSILANIGSMHCGQVPSTAGHLVLETKFLGLAAKLAALES